MPQNSVNDVVQTRDGYLWIATFGGLARYDGRRFRQYVLSSTPAAPAARAVSLLEDRRGALWVGFQDGHLSRLVDGAFVEVPGTGEGLGIVWELAEDREGRVWVATSEGAGVVPPGGSFRWLESPAARPGARSILIAAEGVWIVFNDGVVRQLDTDGSLLRQVLLPAESRAVHSLDSDGEGGFFVSTETGALQWTGGAFRRVVPGDVRRIVAGPEGGWWAIGDGVRSFTTEGSEPVGPVIGRGPYPFVAALFDREGGAWLGTRGGGLLRFRRSPVSWLPVTEDGRRSGVELTLTDVDGGTWVATCGSIQKFAPGARRAESVSAAGSFCAVSAALAADGAAWFSSPIVRVESGRVTHPPLPAGSGVTQLFRNADGGISAVRGELLSRWADGAWQGVDVLPLQPHETVMSSPLARSGGEVWIPTSEGILIWSRGAVRRIGTEDGLAPGGFRSLVEDASGNVWAGSYGGGLSRIGADGAVATLTTEDGLAENVVVGLVLDGGRRLWASGNRFLSVFRLADLDSRLAGGAAPVRTVRFGPGDGYREANGQLASMDPDGRLWFPAIDGVVSVDPAELWEEKGGPILVIESVSADGRPAPLERLRVPSRTRDLVVEYTAPRFDRPDNVHFRYRLRELDPAWTEAGTGRSALFSRLPPGRYTFEVEAIDTETGARAKASTSLRVTPALWQAWWARILAVVVLVGLILLAVRLRVRALKLRAAESEQHARELRREIDERLRAEEVSEELRGQLLRSQKLEAVGRLTGGIAHDFSNLLAVIMGHLELASLKVEDQPELERHVDSAFQAAQRGGALTRQLLAFSRRADLTPSPTDVRALVQGMEPLLRPALGALTELEIEADGEVASCFVDHGRLENVILNLAINARDALTGAGGTVTIGVENTAVDAGRAREWDVASGEYVHLSIADDGSGIPPEVLDKVLDPFFTTKEVGEGTGLGLSMAYGFARQSGGHLVVESEPDVGTTVHLYLPRGAMGRVRDEEPAPPAASGSGERVLVIEDDAEVRGVTVHTLHELGYRTAEAEDAPEARRALLHFPDVRIVLSDVVLPGENGLLLREELRRTCPGLPVILMSGRTRLDEAEDSPEEEGILVKPFSRETLQARLQQGLVAAARVPSKA